MLFFGTVLAYVCIYGPLAGGPRYAESGMQYMEGVIVAPVLLVYGVVYCVLGARATELLGTGGQPTLVAWVLGGVLLAAGFLLYFWMRAHV
jgi:hypothetical protein